jgi:hypothetical protein
MGLQPLIAAMPGVTFGPAQDVVTASIIDETSASLGYARALEAEARFGTVAADRLATFVGADRLHLALSCPTDAGPSLDDLLHVIGRDPHADGDLRWLPESLREAALVSVARLALDFDFSATTLPVRALLSLRLFGGKSWSVAPGLPFPAIGDFSAELEIDHPLEPDLRFATVTLRGAIGVGEAAADRILVTAE